MVGFLSAEWHLCACDGNAPSAALEQLSKKAACWLGKALCTCSEGPSLFPGRGGEPVVPPNVVGTEAPDRGAMGEAVQSPRLDSLALL